MTVYAINCPNCGGAIIFTPGVKTEICSYCGSQVAVESNLSAQNDYLAIQQTAAQSKQREKSTNRLQNSGKMCYN